MSYMKNSATDVRSIDHSFNFQIFLSSEKVGTGSQTTSSSFVYISSTSTASLKRRYKHDVCVKKINGRNKEGH